MLLHRVRCSAIVINQLQYIYYYYYFLRILKITYRVNSVAILNKTEKYDYNNNIFITKPEIIIILKLL